MIHIEVSTLRAFQKDCLALYDRPVHQDAGIHNQVAQPFRIAEIFLKDLFGLKSRGVIHGLEQGICLGHVVFEFLSEIWRI